MSSPSGNELSVRSEPVQTLYGYYLKDRFRVNRRYQRKLVWSVEEKQRLIDSILKGMPIPLFLVAEIGSPPDAPYELIDGLQRLNAIFSFLENEYAVGGNYFDLDSLADTKYLKDKNLLVQKTPVLERVDSIRIANYAIALSVFRSLDSASVEDVFRRINSGGRRLSRQELRQAGTISKLADLVRVISSRIRTDTSPGDVVPLKRMPLLSITNRELAYGVASDDIFWVKQGILRREDVRESLDEQAVLDLLLDCLLDPMANSGTRHRDAYYNFSDLQVDDTPSKESISIDALIGAYGQEKLERDFLRVYDELRAVLETQDLRFSALINAGSGGRSQRYFHVVYMAFYELMFRARMQVKNRAEVAGKLKNIGQGVLNVPAGGGDWNRETKRRSIDAVKGVLISCFEQAAEVEDFSQFSWASELETLLGNAVIEQQMFDCKQGFLVLNQGRNFDERSFEKICKTLVAMANRGPGAVGHIVVGITDNENDAARVAQLDGISAVEYRGFGIVGIDREAVVEQKSLNDYFAWLIQRIRSAVRLDESVSQQVASDARIVGYHNRGVLVLRVSGRSEPTFFDGALYERSGSETREVPQAEYMRIFSRFAGGGS
ncbi:GmrSD restriction endonuclease domain-containing protein [Actinophytocola sp.]|uniref:GmrSD restriction endonuclease domain-containing protein n=1 Tax=Actinophytocola sp. TaxID=1872138 RepID=UPI002D71DC09|nr:DUF262 domain-containing protein [Actinophytocola sp.]HYQ66728.1 DUF262 domain-containing protein [Actinophytocola sp.]